MRKAWACGVAAALLSPLLAVGGAHAATLTTASFVLVRTTEGASDFNLSLSVDVPSGRGLIVDAETYVQDGRVRRAEGGAVVGQDPSSPGVDAAGVHFRTCGYTFSCTSSPPGVSLLGVSYSSSRSRGQLNMLLLVLRGQRIFARMTGHGWRLLRVPLTLAYVPTQTASAASASIAGRGVAAFTGATAKGASRGSVALAIPPCSISDLGVASRGVGRVELDGGLTKPTFTCPVDVAPVASYAAGATTWSLTGFAAGDTTLADTALAVINTPARLPAAAR